MILEYLATPYEPHLKVGKAVREIIVRARTAAAITCAAQRIHHAKTLVYSPIAHSHALDVEHFNRYGKKVSYETWIEMDKRFFPIMDRLVVAKLPGWDKSKGIAIEIEDFEKQGKEVVMWDEFSLPAPLMNVLEDFMSKAGAILEPPVKYEGLPIIKAKKE